jgi:hypothetical protein
MNPDSDEDLFHIFIHPVLDLLHVPLSSLDTLNPNWDALNDYLLMTLADIKEQVLHDAAKKLLDHKKTQPEHWAGARIDDMAKLLHPECDECVEE